jgi:hypothetical protein
VKALLKLQRAIRKLGVSADDVVKLFASCWDQKEPNTLTIDSNSGTSDKPSYSTNPNSPRFWKSVEEEKEEVDDMARQSKLDLLPPCGLNIVHDHIHNPAKTGTDLYHALIEAGFTDIPKSTVCYSYVYNRRQKLNIKPGVVVDDSVEPGHSIAKKADMPQSGEPEQEDFAGSFEAESDPVLAIDESSGQVVEPTAIMIPEPTYYSGYIVRPDGSIWTGDVNDAIRLSKLMREPVSKCTCAPHHYDAHCVFHGEIKAKEQGQ